MNKHVDIIIAGGGMVGAAVACGMGDAGLRIVVIDQQQPNMNWPEDSIDLRVSAINRASQNLLTHVGAWDHILDLGAHPYRQMRVWDDLSRGEIHFDSANIGQADLGHIIQNRSIQKALWQRMQSIENIDLMCPNSVRRLSLGDDHISVELTDDNCLTAELMIGADGANSSIRDMAQIAVNVHDFHQQGVVATITSENSHQDTAWQHFLPTGPLAFLPVSATQCSIVWSASKQQAEQLLAYDDVTFCEALSTASDRRLGEILTTSPRAGFALRSQQAASYLAPRIVLVGDAAHQVHPLAGQGVNLGFSDAAELIDVITRAHKNKLPFSAHAVLRDYERSRKGDNLLIQKSMEGFNALFSNNTSPLKQLRNLGLAAANRSDIAKNFFMRQALGIQGNIPLLCQAQLSR